MTELIDLIRTIAHTTAYPNIPNMQAGGFEQALKRFKTGPERFTGRKDTLELGLWQFSTALNSIGLDNAENIRHDSTTEPVDPVDLAMVYATGRDMIDQTIACLPEHLRLLAKNWNQLSPDVQYDAAWGAFTDLAFTMSNINHPTQPVADDDPSTTALSKQMKLSESLPPQFIRDGTVVDKSNCLGYAFVLAAFGELTGSKYVLFSYIEHAIWQVQHKELWYEIVSKTEHSMYDLPYTELGIFVKEMDNRERVSQLAKKQLEDAHYGVCLQRSDGSWLMIDPYQKVITVVDAEYELDQAIAVLAKYQDVYPGLNVMCHDHGIMMREMEKLDDIRREAYERASKLLQSFREISIGSNITDYDDSLIARRARHMRGDHTINYFELLELLQSSEHTFWIEETLRCIDVYSQTDYDFSFVREKLTGIYSKLADLLDKQKALVKDPEPLEGILLDALTVLTESSSEQHESENAYITEASIVKLFVEAAFVATIPVSKSIYDGETFSHPVIEVFEPVFMLGLALTHQAGCWTDPEYDASLLVRFASSQHFWHDAANANRASQPVDIYAIEQCVRMLPWHHPTIANKLDVIQRRREVHDGH